VFGLGHLNFGPLLYGLVIFIGLWSMWSKLINWRLGSFFTEAFYIGMKQGDIVLGAQASSAGSTTQIAYLGVLGAVTTAGAALSTGGTMTSTFS